MVHYSLCEKQREVKRMREIQDKHIVWKRVGMTVFGTLSGGISVGFLKLAAFGVDPFQSFMAGLDAVIPVRFGTLYVAANVCLLLFGLFADRHYIGLGTLINISVMGYVIEFSYGTLSHIFSHPSAALRVLSFFIGVSMLCFGSAVYFTADMGVSTYDMVALILVNKWHVGKFKFIRIITDLVCVAAGCSLYLASSASLSKLTAIVGLGTVVTAFFMGPLIDFFNHKVAEPFLYG